MENQRVTGIVGKRGKTPGTLVQHALWIATVVKEFRHFSLVGPGSIRVSSIFARGFAPLTIVGTVCSEAIRAR